MVVVRIEIWPHGDKSKARPVGLIAIANDGTGTEQAGNYQAQLANSGKYVDRSGVWRSGEVRGFNRKSSVYHLVYLALRSALGMESQENSK